MCKLYEVRQGGDLIGRTPIQYIALVVCNNLLEIGLGEIELIEIQG